MRRVVAVTFDFWNTLFYETDERPLADDQVDAMAHVLSTAGAEVARPAVADVVSRAQKRYIDSWRAGTQFPAPAAADYCVSELARAAPVADIVRRDLVEAFLDAPANGELAQVDGAAAVVPLLRGAGVRLALVSDTGLACSRSLIRQLERHGLAQHFDHFAFSDTVGSYKPDARIFRDALRGIGDPDPARVAHIGDIKRTDVAGARALGMLTVRSAVYFDDPDPGPEADHVVRAYDALPAVLGL
jgi:FMN phosphatase YigB (HAD superfamily)